VLDAVKRDGSLIAEPVALGDPKRTDVVRPNINEE
jgi:hypothetical protein